MVELISGEPQKLLGIDKTGCYGAVLLRDTLAIKLVFLNFVVVRQRFVPPPPVMQAGPMHEIMQVDQTLLVPTAAPASASDAASCEPSLSAPVPTAPTMAAAVAPPPPRRSRHTKCWPPCRQRKTSVARQTASGWSYHGASNGMGTSRDACGFTKRSAERD